MNRITVYVKGDPGFKPAIITRLGSNWIHSGRDIDEGVISFSLPEKMSIDDFKASIGKDIISGFDVLFFDNIPNDSESVPWKFIPGRPFRMSIWTNNDSNLTGTMPVKPGDES